MQKLPGCRALLPSSGLTKISSPCLSVWPSPSASQTRCLWLWVACSEMRWQVISIRPHRTIYLEQSCRRTMTWLQSPHVAHWSSPLERACPPHQAGASFICESPWETASASISRWKQSPDHISWEAANTCHFLTLFVFYYFSMVFTIWFLLGLFVMTLYSSCLPADISNHLSHGVANALKLKVTWFTLSSMGTWLFGFHRGKLKSVYLIITYLNSSWVGNSFMLKE